MVAAAAAQEQREQGRARQQVGAISLPESSAPTAASAGASVGTVDQVGANAGAELAASAADAAGPEIGFDDRGDQALVASAAAGLIDGNRWASVGQLGLLGGQQRLGRRPQQIGVAASAGGARVMIGLRRSLSLLARSLAGPTGVGGACERARLLAKQSGRGGANGFRNTTHKTASEGDLQVRSSTPPPPPQEEGKLAVACDTLADERGLAAPQDECQIKRDISTGEAGRGAALRLAGPAATKSAEAGAAAKAAGGGKFSWPKAARLGRAGDRATSAKVANSIKQPARLRQAANQSSSQSAKPAGKCQAAMQSKLVPAPGSQVPVAAKSQLALAPTASATSKLASAFLRQRQPTGRVRALGASKIAGLAKCQQRPPLAAGPGGGGGSAAKRREQPAVRKTNNGFWPFR